MAHLDCTDRTGDTCPSKKSLRLDHSSNWPVRGSDKAAGAGHGLSRCAKGGTSNPGGSRPSSVGGAAKFVNASRSPDIRRPPSESGRSGSSSRDHVNTPGGEGKTDTCKTSLDGCGQTQAGSLWYLTPRRRRCRSAIDSSRRAHIDRFDSPED